MSSWQPGREDERVAEDAVATASAVFRYNPGVLETYTIEKSVHFCRFISDRLDDKVSKDYALSAEVIT